MSNETDFPFDRIFTRALTIRRAEESLFTLFQKGLVRGTFHTCIGQELAPVVVSEHLTTDDCVVSNHRGHGHYLAMQEDLKGFFAELMGKEVGVSGGKGGSQHLYRPNFHSHGVLGGILPFAVGRAYFRALEGNSGVSVAFIGDGAFGQGVVYEAMNLASVWKLPLLIVVENNSVAQSTSTGSVLNGTFSAKASAFGIPAYQCDSSDPLNLVNVIKNVFDLIRSSSGPLLLEIKCHRLGPHSKGDELREDSVMQNLREADALNSWLAQMPSERKSALEREVSAKIEDSINWAVSAREAGYKLSSGKSKKLSWFKAEHPYSTLSLVEQIRGALSEFLDSHPRAIVFGEDVEAPYGGAFKVTGDLSIRYPGRVRNAPISEAALAGFANGLAMDLVPSVLEIMFGDFLALTFDQLLNGAGCLPNQFTIRTPMGGGRGYGPTHSQSLEKHFLGMPGVKIFALHRFMDVSVFYRSVNSLAGPKIIVEHKRQYATEAPKISGGFRLMKSDAEIPSFLVTPENAPVDITFVSYGFWAEQLVGLQSRLFHEFDLTSQVLVVTSLWPMDIEEFEPWIFSGSCIVTVEEGVGFAGFGAEVLAQIQEKSNGMPSLRISARPEKIPAARSLEEETLPNLNSVLERTLDFWEKNFG